MSHASIIRTFFTRFILRAFDFSLVSSSVTIFKPVSLSSQNLSSMVVARGQWGMVVEVIFRRIKRIGSSVVQKCCLSHRPTIRRWWLSACMLSVASFLFCAYYITHVQLNRWEIFYKHIINLNYAIFIMIEVFHRQNWHASWEERSRILIINQTLAISIIYPKSRKGIF